MSLWEQLFAAGYDRVMAHAERGGLAHLRATLIAGAAGDVLEIGGGTGANLPFYGAGVERLVITEPAEPMVRRLERKLAGSALPVTVCRAAAEQLPFPDASFDVAVSTLVLCTVEHPGRALAELHRVLRPGGRLLLLEHVRSDDPRLARWQDRLNGVQMRLAVGCHCNRPTLTTVRDAGFDPAAVEHHVLSAAPPIVRPLVVGAATRT